MSIPEVADLTANVATDMLSHFNELHAQHLALGEGATMELEFWIHRIICQGCSTWAWLRIFD